MIILKLYRAALIFFQRVIDEFVKVLFESLVFVFFKFFQSTLHKKLELSSHGSDGCCLQRIENEVNDSTGRRLNYPSCFTLGCPDLHSLLNFFLVFGHGKNLVSHDALQEILCDYELVCIRLCFINEEVFVGDGQLVLKSVAPVWLFG